MWCVPTAASLSRRMREAGWSAQPFEGYCNRCGQTVGPYETDEFGCAACRGRRLPWDRFARLGPHAGALREWIHEVKFTRWRRLGFDLGEMLGRRLLEAGAPRERVCVIPSPMSLRRRLTRGIDHAAVIAAGVAGELGCPLVVALRRKHRRTQRGLSAAERKKNVVGVFTRAFGVDLKGWNVVVVDDVVTTGATMEAMCRALRKRGGMRRAPGVQVWAAALAAAEWDRGGPPTGRPIG